MENTFNDKVEELEQQIKKYLKFKFRKIRNYETLFEEADELFNNMLEPLRYKDVHYSLDEETLNATLILIDPYESIDYLIGGHLDIIRNYGYTYDIPVNDNIIKNYENNNEQNINENEENIFNNTEDSYYVRIYLRYNIDHPAKDYTIVTGSGCQPVYKISESNIDNSLKLLSEKNKILMDYIVKHTNETCKCECKLNHNC